MMRASEEMKQCGKQSKDGDVGKCGEVSDASNKNDGAIAGWR